MLRERELGAFSYDTINKLNHDSTIGLQIYLDPSANQLAAHTAILQTMEKLSRQFPDGRTYKVSFDNTKFIKKHYNVADTLCDALYPCGIGSIHILIKMVRN